MANRDLEKEMTSRAEFELVKAIPTHPNIVEAKEFIVTQNWTYFIMEYAEGQEL